MKTKAARQPEKQLRMFALISDYVGERKFPAPPKAKAEGDVLLDTRTGANVTNRRIPFREFCQVAKIADNFYQRRLYNHLNDNIYKKLIISILEGHLVPELRIGVLTANGEKLTAFDFAKFRAGKYRVTVIDGLQRFSCFLIALYLASPEGLETLKKEKLISPAAYREFSNHVELSKKKNTLSKVLDATIRLEIYYNVERSSVLRYMCDDPHF